MASHTQEQLSLLGENCNSLLHKRPPLCGPKTQWTWLSTAGVSLRRQEMGAQVQKLHSFVHLVPSCPGEWLESVAVRGARIMMGRNSRSLEEADGHAWKQKGKWEYFSTLLSLLWCFAQSLAFGRVNNLYVLWLIEGSNSGMASFHQDFSICRNKALVLLWAKLGWGALFALVLFNSLSLRLLNFWPTLN